jgi:hypothetical protein
MNIHDQYSAMRANLLDLCPENVFFVRCSCGYVNDPDYNEEDINGHARNCKKRQAFRSCSGWILTDLDTVENCPSHPGITEAHPDYNPDLREQRSLQCAEQIVNQSKLNAAYHMQGRLIRLRDRFFPESKYSIATERINREIEKVRDYIVTLESKGYNAWQKRCDAWASDDKEVELNER